MNIQPQTHIKLARNKVEQKPRIMKGAYFSCHNTYSVQTSCPTMAVWTYRLSKPYINPCLKKQLTHGHHVVQPLVTCSLL